MKIVLIGVVFLNFHIGLQAQYCAELIDFVKTQNLGDIYSTYESKDICTVTFYDFMIESEMYHFAIVRFKERVNNSDEIIYRVGPKTKLRYSLDHYKDPFKAFQKHIQPYDDRLKCQKILFN